MAKLRVALIGCGSMGTRLMRECATIPGVSITAFCDVEKEKADALAKEFGAESFKDHLSLLDKAGVDAVIVATPNDSHPPITIDAAKAGKHIFCEKPMALTLEECDAMISAAESAGVKLMVGQVLRLFPGFWKAGEIISSGQLGKPFSMVFSRTGPAGVFLSGWRSTNLSCGGILLEVNAHELDYMRYIMGDAEEVYAQAGNFRTPEVEYEDLSHVIIKFKNGGIGSLQSSIANSIGEYKKTIYCQDGTLMSGGFRGQIQYSCFGQESETIEISEIKKPDPYLQEITNFVKAVTEGSEMVFDAKDGRAAVEMAVAAYRSAKTGLPVKLPL